jgi:hypothetical protein
MEDKKVALEQHKDSVRRNRMLRPSFWKYTTVLLLVVLVVMIYTGGTPTLGTSTVDSPTAVEDAVNFLNDDLLAGLATAELVQVTEDKGLYKIDLKVSYVNGLEEEFTSYVSKDGTVLFPTAIALDELRESTSEIEIEVLNSTDDDTEETVEDLEDIPEAIEDDSIILDSEENTLTKCETFCATEGFSEGSCRETTENSVCSEGETAYGFDQCDGFERCCCA